MSRHLVWFSIPKKCAALAVSTALLAAPSAARAVNIFDGFGDADRNNDGSITLYDTDVNLSGTLNSSPEDDGLNGKGLIEVTTAEDASDVGIIWAATRGFTSSNTGDPKANIKIINDNVATGAELATEPHMNGYALGYEGKGTGSSIAGFFGQSVAVPPNAGDKIVVSVDFRFWRESNNPTPAPNPGELRWGLFQDTDNQLGMTNAEGVDDGSGQAVVTWGLDDGDWRDADPGPVGDKGIWARIPLGPGADPESARINWEWNLTSLDNGRFLEGSGVRDEPNDGGDVGTVASPTGNGPGGSVAALGTHTLGLEIQRLASGGLSVASLINGVEILRDEIKTTDTGYAKIGPPAESFDYVAFRNATGDWDMVLDNFRIQTIVPEPATSLLLLLGGVAGLVRRRR
jgi:hypothetical protein